MASRWIPLLLFVFACVSIQAQQHPFIQYNTRDGLSQSQVRSIAQDSNAFIWFGTVGGVSRFDGIAFRNFSQRDGLPDPQIQDIVVDPNGTVWLATNQGVAYFSGDKMRTLTTPEELGGVRVNALCLTPNGDVLAAYHQKGIFRIHNKELQVVSAYNVPNDIRIHTMSCLIDGSTAVGTRNGLFIIKDDLTEVIRVGDHREKSISDIAQDANGALWISTYGDGIFHLKGDGGSMHYGEIEGLLQNNVRALEIDNKGRVWATTKFGLNLIEQQEIMSFTIYRGMPNDNVWSLYEDREGSIWIGTDGAGVLKYSGDRFVTYTVNDGLCSDLVMCTVEDDSGDLWLGTYGNGVCRLDGMAMINTLDGLPNNTIWSGVNDGRGGLLFGTSDGVCRIVKGIAQPFGEGTAIDRTRVFTMVRDKDGFIWCGTRRGAAIITPTDEVIELPVEMRSIRSIIHVNDTLTYMCGSEGILLTSDKAELRFDETNGLSADNVLCAVLDSKDRLWAGTVNGLSCISDTGIVNLELGVDYGSNYINLISISDEDELSIGTNNGLYIAGTEALLRGEQAEHFTEADGLRSGEFNLNSVFTDAEGKNWFGTTGGLLLNNNSPASGPDSEAAPRVHITGVRSFLKEVDWATESDGKDPRSGLPLGLRIEHAKNYLTFDYVGIDLGEPEKVEYRYQLLGHDDQLLPNTKARFASYSNLSHGDYVFQVMARSPGGQWSEPDEFRFTVLRPFWLTWWFIMLNLLLGIFVIYLFWKWRNNQRVAREKTKQLMLRSRMLQLEQQALNANMNRHFVFNALNSIQFYINKQEKARANKYLTSFAKLIRKNLDNSQSDMTTLAEELERLELYLELEHMRFSDKFDYKMDVASGLELLSVPIPAMMLQPYVENSIWHGILPSERHGVVRITVGRSGHNRVKVEILDNGIGIDESLSRKEEGDHISKGIEITKGRADVLRRMNRTDIRISGPEQLRKPMNGAEQGTLVTIDLPIVTVPRSEGSKPL